MCETKMYQYVLNLRTNTTITTSACVLLVLGELTCYIAYFSEIGNFLAGPDCPTRWPSTSGCIHATLIKHHLTSRPWPSPSPTFGSL